ncbi:T9SS type A sorting domain-containing protein [Hymenobacter psychrophilus]|uniref:Por secretion system C-terminal sorting domain-containing protein n=1 Tax=Hymenobacter psychrophilus TaxID=651662 RepID=A0A1H3K9H6_9BACT|nr:T9SS type A sorting domain-containing protein [Hymenobacter psychrophilus]SDY48836.1 Por secretion system C-terminal sorting domain-containing protein [Hymenobacter psychrophilus]
MTKLYTKGRSTKAWRKLALLGLLGLATGAAHAQSLNYTVANATNVAGTYTDLGTTGTAIATANTDDANSAATPIGFSFSFNGQSFTSFVLNTNGAIRLGAVAPSAADLFITQDQGSTSTDPLTSTNAANTNILMPFNIDLIAGTAAGGAEYRVATTGTAPNRVCTIQWKNVSDKAGSGTDMAATQYASFNFQVKLYETANRVEFVYGAAVAGTGTPGARFPNVGIKGSGSSAGQTVLGARAGSTAAWSTTTFITGNYSALGYTHNFRSTTTPDLGRTYRFNQAPLIANDVAVRSVFTLGQVTREFNSPHVVQAIVTNNSSGTLTNIPVTLTVSGPNTFTNVQTVASLTTGQSATVTFAAYPLTSTGTNTLRVTVPADEVNTNNALVASQNVNTNRLSYIDPNVAFSAGGVGVGGAEGILAAKFSVTKPTTVYTVKPTFAPSGTTPNVSPYQIVLLDATGTGGTPGAILYTSPTQTRPAAGGTVAVAIPNIAVGSDFYVGVKELDTNPGLASQLEDPLRPNTFYYKTATGAWTSVNATTLRTRLALEAGLGTPAACDVPTALTVASPSPTTATVTFTAAAGATGYSIIYGPTGFNPNSAGTTVTTAASPYTITGLAGLTSYDVYIRTNCSASSQSDLVGPVRVTTACQPPIISTFPYTENFDGVATDNLPCGVTVSNVNGDDESWFVTDQRGPASAPNHIAYFFSTTNTTTAVDDWFYTPALFMRAGSTYQLTFKYKALVLGTFEKMEVKYGTAATPAAQTNLLWSNNNIVNTSYVTTTPGTGAGQVMAITPTTSGNVYIGFHANSDADQYALFVDDITVTSAAVTGTSSALQKAINLYPNPTAGNLTVAVSGANAKNGLQVEVTNMLGQRVHTSTVRDNAVKTIDLSNLANGMYTVKVRNGNEFMMRTISVQK